MSIDPIQFNPHPKNRITWQILILLLLIIAGISIFFLNKAKPAVNSAFDGDRAKAWVEQQCAFGYRTTGSEANFQTAEMIKKELRQLGWQVQYQEFPYMGTTVRNILAWKGAGDAVLIGAHYDTRRAADGDDPSEPVMGANDGASGVAVLLELARVVDVNLSGQFVYLAFFDAEDNGRLDGWDWIVGSSYMAAHWGENGEKPLQNAIIIDMIGDRDLNIYMEQNSDPDLNMEIWDSASGLGYGDIFIPHTKYAILDDHLPFLRIDVPAIDVIDFDYPYWHTTQDTPDKVAAASLEVVGRTLESWLESHTR